MVGARPPRAPRGARGKREAGETPARTRHCERGVRGHHVTGKPGRRPRAAILQPGNLPLIGTWGDPAPGREEIGRTEACRRRGPFVLRMRVFPHRERLFFCAPQQSAGAKCSLLVLLYSSRQTQKKGGTEHEKELNGDRIHS